MTRSCHVRDDELRAFAAADPSQVGDSAAADAAIDEHVAGCDECQAFLAELWSGGLVTDLVDPVVRYLRFEEFLIEAAKLAVDVTAGMGKAVGVYLGGAGEQQWNAAGPEEEE